jgi:primosomal protein N' (replication factor Y)
VAIAQIALPWRRGNCSITGFPDGLAIAAGDIVRVRLGTRRHHGVVVALDAASSFLERLQPIEAIAGAPRVPADVMDLAAFTSSYYHAAPGPGLCARDTARHACTAAWRTAGRDAAGAFGALRAERCAGGRGACDQCVRAHVRADAAAWRHRQRQDRRLSRRRRHAIRDGGQALVLVPEINLTPQLEARVQAALPGVQTATLHSGLAAGARRANWDRAASGDAQVVLATRLGVFAPLPGLALVVVDEEHDDSYKQQDGVRYHARDLAVWRARQRGVPIVLGSATPSLETWAQAKAGRYRTITLAARADCALAAAGNPLRACARRGHT